MGFKSFLLLALHFWKHVFLKVTFLHRPGGSARFIDNYRADRLLPVAPATRRALASWHGCVACGVCDAMYPHPEISLMGVVLAGGRDFSRMSDVAPDAARLSEDRGLLERAARHCPTGVPIDEVVEFVASSGGDAPILS